jgi:hypothetical protein
MGGRPKIKVCMEGYRAMIFLDISRYYLSRSGTSSVRRRVRISMSLTVFRMSRTGGLATTKKLSTAMTADCPLLGNEQLSIPALQVEHISN